MWPDAMCFNNEKLCVFALTHEFLRIQYSICYRNVVAGCNMQKKALTQPSKCK